MRLDSPFVLAMCGTLAIHTMLLVAGDALVVINPREPSRPPPRIEMVDVQVRRPTPPPKVEPKQEVVEPVVEDKAPIKQPPTQTRTRPTRVAAKQPVQETQETQPTSTDSGGAPVVRMGDLVPTKDGIAVQEGTPSKGKTGLGGQGGGRGAGRGSGAADPPPPPPPVSIATIKTKAMPKGDFGYIDAGRDYPPEARRLGIEGVIKVKLVVDAKGKVQSATLMNRLGHGLDELALAKARQIQFEPAKDTSDRPVASLVIWTFNMTLPK